VSAGAESGPGDPLEILFLCHRIPYPPDKGDKIRSYHLLARLARRHRVTLGTLVDDPADRAHVHALEELCREVHAVPLGRRVANVRGLAHLATGGSLSIGYFRSRPLARWVEAVTSRRVFDLVFAFSSSTAPYARAARTRGPRIMDLVDLDSEKWRQYAEVARPPLSWLYRTEGRRVRRLESEILESFDHSLVCTPQELEDLRAQHRHGRASVIPNGVELERFPFGGSEARESAVAFTGAMDYLPNADAVLWFHREVFPRVRRAHPDVRFWVVGRNPGPRVRRLAEDPAVTVTGAVPDVSEWLRRARVAVAPLRVAQGIQNKILEAMCSGTPVVATSRGFLGIQAEPGREVVVADEPEAFAAAVDGLLRDQAARAAMARAARAVVEARYCWDASADRVEAVFREEIRRRESG